MTRKPAPMVPAPKTNKPIKFAQIAPSLLKPSKTNPRGRVTDDDVLELRGTIGQHGVIEPLVVREAKGDTYEIVCGERRWLAAKLNNQAAVPCMVYDLTDEEVIVWQMIENDQREDLPPLAQAAGYRAMIDAGLDVLAIAEQVGRTTRYVYARLELLKLTPANRKDLESGKLPFAHASLLARLGPVIQETLRERYKYNWPPALDSLRDAIRSDAVSNVLSTAPWDLADADLIPKAGPCTTCPKQSGANRDLFADLMDGKPKKADVCFDSQCWLAKRTAFVELQIRRVAADEGTLPKDSETIVPAEVVRVSERYYLSDRDKAQIGKNVVTSGDYQVVTKKEAEAAKPGTVKPAVIVDGENAGKTIYIRTGKPASQRQAVSPSEARRNKEQRLASRVASAVLQAVYDKASNQSGGDPGDIITQAMIVSIGRAWYEAKKAVAHCVDPEHKIDLDQVAAADKTSDAQRVGIFVAVAYATANGISNGERHQAAIREALGVDARAIKKKILTETRARKQVRRAAKASRNGQAKPKRKKVQA